MAGTCTGHERASKANTKAPSIAAKYVQPSDGHISVNIRITIPLSQNGLS
eukprot:CAMPEP_0172726090 /NCGR_PEP_ID=MMETSP1074-20121228/89910_1 /TAXON_ID=2916 /ORGANISM="Ceratium fusus, Strain PA161109" /LENGTH=49 /DNA_ID= /DNA_START= /DNA_END= /DNA_ORIENTATION=